MSKNYGWNRQVTIGTNGEARIFAYLTAHGHTVTDLRSEQEWQQRDIDAHVSGYGYCDVKTDTYHNDRIYVEVYNGSYAPGAIIKTRADYWLYYKERSGMLYAFKPAEVVGYVLSQETAIADLKPVLNAKGKPAAYGVTVTYAQLEVLPGTKMWRID